MRNKLTVIKGWIEKIKEDGYTERSVSKVDEASSSLMELTDQAQEIRSTLNEQNNNQPVSIDGFDSQFTDDRLNVEYRLDNDTMIPNRGLMSAQYLVDRCLTEADSAVSVCFKSGEDSVTMEVESKSQLLRLGEISYLNNGIETPLDHADDLKIAHVYILIKSVGGDVLNSENNEISVEFSTCNDSK